MTNPTPLSPAAQAVLDAASDVYWGWTDMSPAASHTIAAAALCAAANQLTSTKAMLQLQAIADELDGTSPSESD